MQPKLNEKRAARKRLLGGYFQTRTAILWFNATLQGFGISIQTTPAANGLLF
jgi:hypothetical protein